MLLYNGTRGRAAQDRRYDRYYDQVYDGSSSLRTGGGGGLHGRCGGVHGVHCDLHGGSAAATMLPHTMAALARAPAPLFLISEAPAALRPPPPALASTLHMKPTVEQLRALERLAEYPRKMERWKRIWAEYAAAAQRGTANRPGSGGGGARSRSSARLVGVGASTVGEKLPPVRTRAHSVGGLGRRYRGSRGASRSRGHYTGPLSAEQISDLMTRELSPEDYELLLLLDEGVNKVRTLGPNAAAALPVAEGAAWVGEACRICLCELEEDEDVRTVPNCGHAFHAPCITHWLTASRASCPLCGAEVPENLR
eukprot:TRINITY_DN73825_c0_g1_i1.p1 TRINITY_DN73825_c0_g1~~TRINITY_DN73825_c0_g1_i1.p1  ORF type:complete len:317 (-),score=46.70 TRINITY_DN73825_c0_g1_i1:62-991(-)